MQDLQRARQLLCEQDFTCVLCRGERVYTSRKTGISPMLDWITDGEDLAGYAAADRIVGKAAAMLFDLAGIRTLHAQVLSEPALQYLKSHNIDVSYDTLTLHIINRRGDGICPMERAAAGISDAQEALRILYDTRERLRQGESI